MFVKHSMLCCVHAADFTVVGNSFESSLEPTHWIKTIFRNLFRLKVRLISPDVGPGSACYSFKLQTVNHVTVFSVTVFPVSFIFLNQQTSYQYYKACIPVSNYYHFRYPLQALYLSDQNLLRLCRIPSRTFRIFRFCNMCRWFRQWPEYSELPAGRNIHSRSGKQDLPLKMNCMLFS